MEPTAVQPMEHVPEWASWTTVYVFHVAIPAILVLIATARALRAARRARLAANSAGSTHEPGEVAIQGRVEFAPGRELAVRTTIDQQAKVDDGIIVWREVARGVDVEAFYLVTDGGDRIRVEPTQEVVLNDKLDRVVPIERTRRQRVAELSEGEKVFASGELATDAPGGYRTGKVASSLVLRAPKQGQLLLSTESLEFRHRGQARREGLYAAALFLCMTVFGVFDAPYHARTVTGALTTGTVVHSEQHALFAAPWRLKAETPDGTVISDDVEPAQGQLLKRGASVHVIAVEGFGFLSQIGRHNSINEMMVQLTFPFFLTGILGYLFACWLPDRPWYRGSKVVDAEPGELPPADG